MTIEKNDKTLVSQNMIRQYYQQEKILGSIDSLCHRIFKKKEKLEFRKYLIDISNEFDRKQRYFWFVNIIS